MQMDSNRGVEVVGPSDVRHALERPDGDASLIFAAWHAEAEIAGPLSTAAADVLEGSLMRLLGAELPQGSVVARWGRNRVVAVLPETSRSAAAQATERARRAWRASWQAPVHFAGVVAGATRESLERAETLCESEAILPGDRVALVA